MLRSDRIAVDASFLLKIFLPEDKSDQAEELWKKWIADSVEVVAPTLIAFEVASVIRNKLHNQILEENEGSEIINNLKHLDLTLFYTEDLLDIAWEIGGKLKTSALYDSFYIALAKLFKIPLWTADKKLFQLVKKKFPFINLL
jgi:predicted nucleic acid-binding protein